MEVNCVDHCEEMVVELLGMTYLVMADLAMTVVKLVVQLVVHHLVVAKLVNYLVVLAREGNDDEERDVEVGEEEEEEVVLNQIHLLENAFHD